LTEEVISDYFALLKEEMTKGNFMNSPNRIYNVDETGISLDGHTPWVIAIKRAKEGMVQDIKKQKSNHSYCLCEHQWPVDSNICYL